MIIFLWFIFFGNNKYDTLEDSTENTIRQLVSQPKSDTIAWSWKGGGLKSIGKFKEAIACFDNALELYPIFFKLVQCR